MAACSRRKAVCQLAEQRHLFPLVWRLLSHEDDLQARLLPVLLIPRFLQQPCSSTYILACIHSCSAHRPLPRPGKCQSLCDEAGS